ncbi:MAG: hypothetical protein D4R43_04265 [Sphingobacteriales bacterium]|nr:MAG: hypothetical protein D4R43_04265 [Sphingobacteriales bacterium]
MCYIIECINFLKNQKQKTTKQKLFTLIVLTFFLATNSFAQTFHYTVGGNLTNTNGLSIPVYYIDSLIGTTIVNTTDANGNYQFNITRGSGNVELYFYNCQGNMVDTFIWVNSAGATWNVSVFDTLLHHAQFHLLPLTMPTLILFISK